MGAAKAQPFVGSGVPSAIGPARVSSLCRSPECRASVPFALAGEGLCVMHYTLKMEADCGQYRCEIARGTASLERQAEIGAWIARYSHTLAHVASGTCLPDDRKRRVLNTFMTLMILRENLDRAAHRTPPIVESCT